MLIVGYPKFFTPNGDAYHNVSNTKCLSNQLNTRTYIFDWYDKLLKDISTIDSGWGGTNVRELKPACDYWFTMEYAEQNSIKIFKSHFALKR